MSERELERVKPLESKGDASTKMREEVQRSDVKVGSSLNAEKHLPGLTIDGLEPAKSKKVEFTPSLEPDIGDVNIFDKEVMNKYRDWAARVAGEHHLPKDHVNAFRHALVSAVMTFKYGEHVANAAGASYEATSYPVTEGIGRLGQLSGLKFDSKAHEADTKADLKNNEVGRHAATELLKEKGRKNVSLNDVVQAVLKEYRAGKLVTDASTLK